MRRKKTKMISNRSGQIALPWPTATQLSLNVLSGKFEPLEIILCHKAERRFRSET